MAWTGSLTDLQRRLAQSQPLAVSGGIGGAYTAPQTDLSFLNDPNNPYYQQQATPQTDTVDIGGTGSGYATQEVTTTPKQILEQSPEWIAYLASLGLEKNQFAADIERQRGLAGAEATFRKQALGPQYEQQRRNISASNESRGMARSGMQLRDIANSRRNMNTASSAIDLGLNSTVSGLESSLAQKNLDLETQKRQQEASMIGAGYVHG